MSNPLLAQSLLPAFSDIKPEHIEPAIDALIAENRAHLDSLLKREATELTIENFLIPFEDGEDRLERAWSPVSHMNAVVNSDELRDAYNACLPKLSQYATELGQNKALFNVYKSLQSRSDFAGHSTAQKKVIENALRDL